MEIKRITENEMDEICGLIERACKHSVFALFYPPQPQYFTVTREEIAEKAENGHFYVVKENGKLIGCGCIGAYRGSMTESLLNTIFVDPNYQGKGVGKKIIARLENDEYAKRAKRLEIHAAISAIPFYRKLGYEHKNGRLHYCDGRFELEKYLQDGESV